MQHLKIPLEAAKSFTAFFLDYIQKKEQLAPFYDHFPSPENFNKLLTIKGKSFPDEHRQRLASVLKQQYADLNVTDAVKENLEAISEKGAFTVTTGHQLNIFTGPLFFIFKIVTVINTCRELRRRYPQFKFVPVYWLASEDHDYEEIRSFRLNGKKYTWETSQKGAVGRFSTADMRKVLDEVPGDISVFRNAYLSHHKLSHAVRAYVNDLFGAEGVLALDADNRELKSLFRNVMSADILQGATLPIVEKTNTALGALGYKTQVYCRDINFFYLDDKGRSRIEKNGECYSVTERGITLSPGEMSSLIRDEPEKLSPNVILRPLYQEMILPNVAYVGGPAEVVYWLQLKELFAHFQTPFPAVMPRNFGMIIDQAILRKFRKTGLEIQDLFEEKNYLFNHWVLKNTHHNLSVGAERDRIFTIFNDLRQRAESIDKTLGPFVGAEGKRALNSVEKIETKMIRAEKRRHAEKLRQISEVKDALFPNGGLQERTDNFLNFYQQDNQFISKLIAHFDPFDFRFNILTYSEE